MDLEKQASEARAPSRKPKTLPKVLHYQTRKPPAGWPNGVKKTPETEPEQEYTTSKSLEELE